MTSRLHDQSTIALPAPKDETGVTLFAALQQRQTVRELSDKALEPQQLSNLCWAAYGVNRRVGPFGQWGRTAASASNSQEIDLYVLLHHGAYRYEAGGHVLTPVAANDLRAHALTPGQGGVEARAPLALIYVADVHRLSHTQGFQEPGLQDPEVQKSYYYADAGLIAQNVYLFAAGNGLAAWFHNCDKAALARHLKLNPDQRALFAQSVGYPKNG
jgi:hypothetical protein